jgi:RIO kinase 1
MSTDPAWLVTEPCTHTALGVLRSGKEAQISLIERSDGQRSCLLASKHYLPREVTAKGQLEALGVSRATQFRHDVTYREGRQFRRTRDRRAVERMTAHGRQLLQARWTNHEHDVLRVLWDGGVQVPYPVGFADDRLLMQFLGDREQGAAPTLARLRPRGDLLHELWDQLVTNLERVVAAGWAHGDLSAYNLLWWQERLWFIDLPQAVDLAANPMGLDFLHRDIANIVEWFARQGLERDEEEVFASLLVHLAG